jgi:hypothetical protein
MRRAFMLEVNDNTRIEQANNTNKIDRKAKVYLFFREAVACCYLILPISHRLSHRGLRTGRWQPALVEQASDSATHERLHWYCQFLYPSM